MRLLHLWQIVRAIRAVIRRDPGRFASPGQEAAREGMALDNIQILALCVAFGGVCAFYVTAVGFILSALVMILILAGLTWIVGMPSGVWTLAGAFVALQVGYFLGIVGTALAGSVSSTVTKESGEPETGLKTDRD